MNIYLAGPIDLVGANGQSWKKILVEALATHESPLGQWTAFDPAAPFECFGDFTHSPHRGRFIEAINSAALTSSDVMVAYVPSDKVSVGTVIELEQAADRVGKFRGHDACPPFILTDIPWGKSIYLMNRATTRAYYLDKPSFETVEEWLERAAAIIADISDNHHSKLAYREASEGMEE